MPFDIWNQSEGGLWGGSPTPPVFEPLGLTGIDPEDLPRSVRNGVFAAVAPSPDAVAVKEEEQNAGAWGTIGSILSLPEKVLFGQAIKGAVKGGIEGGVEGALKGFARGTPFAFLGEALGLGDLADETSFAAIRRATGQTDVEEGAANFLLNLAGDVLLSPVELLAAPFAVTKAGAAANAAAKAAGRIAGKASLAKAIATGERAALVFRLPFAKSGFAATNLGFKSGAITVGQGLDAIGAFIRTNPVTGALVKTFSPVARVKDPEVARMGRIASESVDETRRTVMGKTLQAYLDGVTPQGRALVESGKYRRLLTTFTEFGAAKVDDLGTFDEAIRKLSTPDVTLREIRRDALIASPRGNVVGELWSRAKNGDVEAIKTLYARHGEIPLDKDMLALAGLEARPGVELSWTAQKNLGLVGELDPATRGLGKAAGSQQGKRLLVAEATPDAAAQAVQKAREGLQDDFRALVSDIESGKVSQADVDSFLSLHKRVMTDIGRADIQAGFLNEAMEPFLGLYAPRIFTPEVMDHIERHFVAKLSKYNYSTPRKLRDMLAVEINAVAEDVGLKATGFIPLKARKLGADGVLGHIFDKTFRRELAVVSPQAAEMFQILPAQNIFERAAASAERQARAAFGKTFFADDSAAVIESLTPEEFAKRGGRYGPGSGYRAVVETKSGIETPTWADTVTRQAAPEIEAQYEIAAHTIREDSLSRMMDAKRDFDAEWRELRAARDITADSAPAKLQQAKSDAYATLTMKRAANDLRAAKSEKDLAEKLLRIHKAKAKGVGATADADAVAQYAEFASQAGDANAVEAALKERLGRAKDVLRARSEFYDASKSAINDFLDELDRGFDEITGEFKDAVAANREGRREALAGILADKRQRSDLVDSLRKRGMSGRMFAQEIALQRKYAGEGVMAIDEAAGVVVDEKTGQTLLDRMRARWGQDTRIKIVTEDAFNAYRSLAEDMAKPDSLRNSGIVSFMDSFKQAWAGHTIYNPLFLQTRARNWVQSAVAAASNGLFSLRGQWESAHALGVFRRSLKEGAAALDELGGVAVHGTDVPLRDALQKARQLGVVGAAGYAYEVGLTMEQAAARTASAPVKQALKDWRSYVDFVVPTRGVAESPALQLGLRMENTLDDHARFAAFLGGLKKGMDFETAASSVRRALYDSSKPLSWTERTIFRRLIPFYSFQKYAIGQMADLYFSRPAAVASFEKVRRNAFAATGMKPEELDTAMPGFIADGYAIPWKNTERGPSFRLFGTYLPIGEVARIASMFDDYAKNPDGADPALRYFVGNMHPILKSSLESLLNRDVYSNRAITDFPGQSLEMFGIPMPKMAVRFAQQLRFVNELNKLNVLNFTEAQTLLSEVKRFRSDETSVLERLSNSAFSPVPIPGERVIDVEQEGKYRNKKDEARFREAKGRMVRAAIGEERAYTDANMEALRGEMTEAAARIRRRDRLMGRYTQKDPEMPRPPQNPLERLLLGR